MCDARGRAGGRAGERASERLMKNGEEQAKSRRGGHMLGIVQGRVATTHIESINGFFASTSGVARGNLRGMTKRASEQSGRQTAITTAKICVRTTGGGELRRLKSIECERRVAAASRGVAAAAYLSRCVMLASAMPKAWTADSGEQKSSV